LFNVSLFSTQSLLSDNADPDNLEMLGSQTWFAGIDNKIQSIAYYRLWLLCGGGCGGGLVLLAWHLGLLLPGLVLSNGVSSILFRRFSFLSLFSHSILVDA
jgi:hypothetical protein